MERKEDRRKAGLDDRHTDYAAKPLAEHVKDWYEALKVSVSERRQKDLRERMAKLIAVAEWKRLADITEDTVRAALAKLDIGLQTKNHYLTHVKQFLRWCVPERLPMNPLCRMKRWNVSTDRRHDRRDLTPEEQAKLIATTEAGPVRCELDGPTRAMLYDFAFATGLRRGELRSLSADSFDFDSDTPTVTVAAAYSKHRKQDVIPLPPSVAARMRTWLADGRPLWPNLTRNTAYMLRGDLKAAGIPYVVEGPDGPLFADFHSTRHTYATAVCRTDAPIKDMMAMTRHSTPDLFLKTYAKTNIWNKARVAEQLPDPRGNTGDGQMKATG